MLISLGLVDVPREPNPGARAFVRPAPSRGAIARNAWAERLILAGWLAIAVKSLLVIWAVEHWAIPFHPYWINGPTFLMAAVVTAIYFGRNRG